MCHPTRTLLKITGIIVGKLYIFVKSSPIGHLMGEAGGYVVAGERYAPDVAFISSARQPQLVQAGYNPIPSELAVEVISPTRSTEELNKLRIKITNYLSAGVMVWVVDPHSQTVYFHELD